MQWLMVALGGALGAVCRYAMGAYVHSIYREHYPWGTLIVNVLGSLLIGIAYVVIVEKGWLPPLQRHLLMVGFLGAFTTFSTFSLDTIQLFQHGHTVDAFAYVLANVVLSITAAGCGLWLAQRFS